MEENNLLEERKRRLQQMGVPEPVAPVNPGNVVNVKDPKMLQRIQQIRSGGLKEEFKQFDKQGKKEGFVPMDVPKPNAKKGINQPKPEGKPAPRLESFDPNPSSELSSVEKMFDDTSTSSYYNQTPYQGDPASEGRDFIQNFRNKLHNNLQQKQQQVMGEGTHQQNYNPTAQQPIYNNQVPLQSGLIVLNEEDLKKKIIAIAKQVAGEIIKQVLNEYVTNLKENKQKSEKAQVLPGGKIQIDGKIYKQVSE